MKVSMFHLMPYRDLPDDFEQKYHSVWVDPPWTELGDAEKVGQYYNWSLDELIHAAKAGMDGICVNEHHQNAYGFMPNPNLMGSVLARATNGMDVAVVQMGSTSANHQPAHARSRRVRHAGYHQRRAPGGRHAAGNGNGRHPVCGHYPD